MHLPLGPRPPRCAWEHGHSHQWAHVEYHYWLIVGHFRGPPKPNVGALVTGNGLGAAPASGGRPPEMLTCEVLSPAFLPWLPMALPQRDAV